MKIPRNKVKIGAYDYKIKWKKNITHNDNELWGLCDHDSCEISLSKNMGSDRLGEVFMHECLHVMEEVYGIKLGEKKVNALGMALLAFFKDNKIEF